MDLKCCLIEPTLDAICELGIGPRNNAMVVRGGGEKSIVQTIAEWLATLGLSEYAQRFADNYIDASVLPDLTDQDLTELGVPLGHRRKILRAIAELPAAPAPAETATELVPRDDAERRQLTVMFCDLVGSTALSARVDRKSVV